MAKLVNVIAERRVVQFKWARTCQMLTVYYRATCQILTVYYQHHQLWTLSWGVGSRHWGLRFEVWSYLPIVLGFRVSALELEDLALGSEDSVFE